MGRTGCIEVGWGSGRLSDKGETEQRPQQVAEQLQEYCVGEGTVPSKLLEQAKVLRQKCV